MSLVTDILKAELTDLATALQAHGIPVIIGGGYGLLLRQKHIAESGVRTIRAVPEARSTSDLDIFLSMEIVTNAARMGALRDVLHGFGYAPVAGAEHYQFRREISYRGARRSVKVDLLAPPPRDLALLAKVRVDVRRIRPRTSQGIHAHTTPEAFLVDEQATAIELGGVPEIRVMIPHPYAFLLLKLYAYRDRRRDPGKELGVYHAFDLYRIVAMMNEAEYNASVVLRDRFEADEIVVEARRIVAELFCGLDAPGALAILEHARTVGATIREKDLDEFLEDLGTFFPPRGLEGSV